jgi:lysophospholipase L1-like esterase
VEPRSRSERTRVARSLLLLAGLVFLAAGVLYNEALLGWLAGKQLHPPTVALIRSAQISFLSASAIFLTGGWCSTRVSWLRACLETRWGTPLLLGLLAVGVPLALAELSLRPLARSSQARKTTLFQRDAELGWRLRPGARDVWGGVRVEVNLKGLRGPELDYEKTPGAERILYLGDSVTFGFGLERYQDTFPHQVELALRERGVEIETLNAGVGGWSPWQHARFLEREGMRYDPDLVVVAFVLNDVTEKMLLVRFGGPWDGFQLSQTADLLDRVLGTSALLHFSRRALARLRFGQDTVAGATRAQLLDVRALVFEPERPDVAQAWEITLANLGRIVEHCRELGVRVALVVLPYRFQLEDPNGLSAPQAVLETFARDRLVPSLDLLPALAGRVGVEEVEPADYFLDQDHLSARGSRVVARLISEFLVRESLVAVPSPEDRSQPDRAGSAQAERDG